MESPRRIESYFLDGAAGKIECLLEEPESGEASEACLVCHPHPLFGGTLHNKVVFQVAKSIDALKPGGVFLWSEARAADQLEGNFTPVGRTMYGASTMHCMTVSLAQGGEGLGSVIGEKLARELVREAGFSDFQLLPVKNPYHQIFAIRK